METESNPGRGVGLVESDREASPAQSHASGAALEWDPSADVGSHVPSNTPVHQHSNPNLAVKDTSALDQILVAFTCGFDLGPYVAESRSQRFGSEAGRLSRSGSESSSFKTATEETGFDEDPSANGSTSLSNWQTSGLTRSEIEYMSRRQTDGSTRSSSLLWVEIHAEDNEATNKRTSDSENRQSTGKRTTGSANTESTGNTTTSSGHIEGKTEASKSLTSGEENASSRRSSASRKTVGIQTETATLSEVVPREKHSRKGKFVATQSAKVKEDTTKKHRHLPEKLVATRVEHHRCKTLPFREPKHGVGHVDFPAQINGGSCGSSTSDAASTCAVLEQLLRDGTCNCYAYHTLEHHRNSLIHKMRREFQHLEKLNSLLLKRRGSSTALKSSCSIAANSSDIDTKSSSKDEMRKLVRSKMSICDDQKGKRKHKAGGSRESSSNDSRREEMKPITTRADVKKIAGGESDSKAAKESRKPVAFFVPFEPQEPVRKFIQRKVYSAEYDRRNNFHVLEITKSSEDKENSIPEDMSYTSGESDLRVLSPGPPVTLQEAFNQYCPQIKAHVEKREMLLRKLRMNREVASEVKRDYFRRRNTLSPNDSLNQALPPEGPRLMSTKEMRLLTEKKIKTLPEVREKIMKRRFEDEKKTNRLLSRVFSRKLRQHALKGDVNISPSKALIRH